MSPDSLNATFAALSDPTRRAILERLARGEASVGELAEPFGISMPAISKHLKVLEKASLITRQKDAQWRRCQLSNWRCRRPRPIGTSRPSSSRRRPPKWPASPSEDRVD